MYTEPAVNSVAAFLRLSRPINFSPLHVAAAVPSIQLGPRNRQLAALSTGFIGGFTLYALYASIFKGDYHAHNANDTFVPVQWLEYPADYISPVMDLFSDDQAPLGVSSDSCPKDSEHLERAFHLLRSKHLAMKFGVPSVVNHDTTLVVLLKALGITSSSSSADFLPLYSPGASSTQGGSQQKSGSSGGTGEDKNGYYNWTGIATASIVVAISLFGLLEKRRRSPLPPASSSEPCTSLENSDFDSDRNLSLGDSSALVSRNEEPSSRVVIGILIDPKTHLKLLLEDDPLVASYTPYVVLVFSDNYWAARSDVGRLETGPAPDGFAARFDALQDALPSLQELQRMTETLLPDLVHFAQYCMAIILCFSLRVVGFFVTGRFGRRGIKQLMKKLKDRKPSVRRINDDAQIIYRTDVDISATTTTSITRSDIDDPSTVNDDMEKAYEGIVHAANGFTVLQPSSSTSSSVTLVEETVETILAPVVDDSNGWKLVERRGRNGKGKSTAEDGAQKEVENVAKPLVEPVSTPSSRLKERDALPFMPRLRGSRGYDRGRGPRPAVAAPA